MEIILTHVEEAGMPADMATNCKTLIERRILNVYGGNPKVGDEVTILYSEKDPLMESEEVDDTAYDVYFTVEKVEPGPNGTPAKKVELSLVF